MIRLLSIEDHWSVVEGLKAKFRARDEISIPCSAGNMAVALDTDPDSFDVILLDLHIPGTNPVDNVAQLKEKFPGKPIVILTSEENSVWEYQMCEAGVQAYINKRESRKTMKAIIKPVAAGEDFCRKRLEEMKLKAKETTTSSNLPFLKPNEKAIIALIMQDKNMNEIADIKIMTPTAVSKVMAKLRKQYNVKTNIVLIRFITENKLL